MKYELLKDDTKEYAGRILYRIKNIDTGNLGGYIEAEHNLSHMGSCWVHYDAMVYDDARVHNDAQIIEGRVFDNARIHGKAKIIGSDSKVYGYAEVYDNAEIRDSEIYGCAEIYGRANIKNSEVRDCAHIQDALVWDCDIDAQIRINGAIRLEGLRVPMCLANIGLK